MTQTTLENLILNGFSINFAATTVFTKQRGPTCGLYTIQNAQEGFGMPITYPATLNNSNQYPTSLRKIAKGLGLTALGEIYDANSFHTMAVQAGLKARVDTVIDLFLFWIQIRFAILKDQFVAVPVSNAILFNKGPQGDNPHWVLVIGIKVGTTEMNTFVAVTTWGKVYYTKFHHLFIANQTINDRPQRYKVKTGPMKYDESTAEAEGAITIPEYKASINLAKKMVILAHPHGFNP